MKNISSPGPQAESYTKNAIGKNEQGRHQLGGDMPVLVHRLMHYAVRDVLEQELGSGKAAELLYKAGHLAGAELAQNALDLSTTFSSFAAELQRLLRELKIGILRMKHYDKATGDIVLTVSENLDCSGLPNSGDVACTFDEGFIAGILEAYTHRPYAVREMDCWASGDRVCRFRGSIMEP
jgi:predicted hydrocarbon binding protein